MNYDERQKLRWKDKDDDRIEKMRLKAYIKEKEKYEEAKKYWTESQERE